MNLTIDQSYAGDRACIVDADRCAEDPARSRANDDLARFSVRKLLPLRRASESAQRRTVELEQERARLAEALAVQERQLEEFAAQVRTRIAAARYAESDAFARPAGRRRGGRALAAPRRHGKGR